MTKADLIMLLDPCRADTEIYVGGFPLVGVILRGGKGLPETIELRVGIDIRPAVEPPPDDP